LIGDIILAEILQGFDKDSDYKKAIEALEPFECIELGGKKLAVKINIHFIHQYRSIGEHLLRFIDD
jgi:hypothetical protein